jgi:hypothetical protein
VEYTANQFFWESKIMSQFQQALRGLVLIGVAGTVAACSSDLVTPSGASDVGTQATSGVTAPAAAEDNPARATDDNPGAHESSIVSALAGTLRLRCERRSGRSKISVDGNNLSPRNGRFHARVRAAGGTAVSTSKRAVGDEVEFDFDSDRDDIAAGATRISASFIKARSGPDVTAEILSAQGVVVAKSGADCRTR